ncbi:MAG: DUF885 family protein [bacterium]|nr:DUF885 family protein [bacterium]
MKVKLLTRVICWLLYLAFILPGMISLNCSGYLENRRASQLADDFIDWYAHNFPTEATAMGIHKFDDKLETIDSLAVAQWKDQLNSFSARIQENDIHRISRRQRQNLTVIDNKVNQKLFELKEWKRWQQDAVFYTERIYQAVNGLTTMAADSSVERDQNLIARIHAIPDFLSKAKQNLTNIDRVNLDRALSQIQELEPIIGFQVAKNIHSDALSDSIKRYADWALDSLLRFETFIKTKLNASRSDSSLFSRQQFQQYINSMLTASIPLDTLAQQFENEIDQIVEQMQQLARSHYRKPSTKLTGKQLVKRLNDEIEKDMPRKDQIFDLCRQTEKHVRRFLDDIATLDIPMDYQIRFEDQNHELMTPGKLLMLEHSGIYQKMPVFVCRVQSVTSEMDLFQQLALLRAFNKPTLVWMILTEALPLHINYWSQRKKEIAEAAIFFPDPVLMRGWPIYFAQKLIQMGYGGYKPELKFTAMKKIAQIYFNALVEIKYYQQNLTFQQVERLFADSQLYNRRDAEEMWIKIHCYPAEDILTAIGLSKLRRLEAQLLKQQTGDVNHRIIPKIILKSGPIPIE